jgi:chaperonin GroES
MSKLIPLNGFVVLEPIEESEQKVGVIVIPDLGKERPEMATVVGTSQVYNFNTDKDVNSKLVIGDIVLLPKLGTMKITHEGKDYYITKETEILAKLN